MNPYVPAVAMDVGKLEGEVGGRLDATQGEGRDIAVALCAVRDGGIGEGVWTTRNDQHNHATGDV